MTLAQRFVGRDEALSVFYMRFAYRHMKNGVYYYGGGGLGKTWILKKILLDNQDDPTRVVTDVIDFFDTQNHSIRGLQTTIRSRLQAPEAFRPYDVILERLNAARLEGDAVHSSAIASLESRANSLFIECCQQAVLGREFILLFDTFERVQQRHVGQWLLQEFLPQVRNLIVAIAGRPDPVPARMPDNVVSYELKGLNLEETREYIHRHLPEASEEVVQSIWKRTGGAPLIIDLILDLPMPVRGRFVTELSKLKDDKQVQDSPELQRGLVGRFSRPDRRNKVIWAMAYLKRRFDVQMLKYIVENGEWFQLGEYGEIFEELGQSVYVKESPERQTHLLHDEVQRMVAEYLLEEAIDPWREMREPLYNLIVNHYYPEVTATADSDLARQLQAEQLGYILDRDPVAGLERYEAYRREVEDTHDYDFEELLWGEVREHLDEFEDRGYQVCHERGEWLRKRSLFQKAGDHYRQMVPRFEEHQVGSRQALGFVLMRQGEVAEARAVFEGSRELVGEDDHKAIAKIENNLGQTERIAGQWHQALEHYAHSLRAATLAHDVPMMVSVYTNRSFLYSLQGLYSHAKQQCKRAIQLLDSLPSAQENVQRAIYAWMNLGTAYRYSSDYSSAAQHYEKSLELARKNENLEAVCDALQHMGINEHLRGRALRRKQEDLTTACKHQLQAWQQLTEALEMARESDWRRAIASGLHRLAHVYREVHRLQNLSGESIARGFARALRALQRAAQAFQMPFGIEYEHELLMPGGFAHLSWLERAAQLFEVSALVADEVNDFRGSLDSLTEFAYLLLELNHFEQVPIVLRRIERIKGYDYQEELFAAISEIALGSLCFEQGKYDDALEKYGPSYAKIAKLSGYASYLLDGRLRNLTWRFSQLSPEVVLQWCDTLEEEWLEESISTVRPDMLDLIERVRFEALEQLSEHTGE